MNICTSEIIQPIYIPKHIVYVSGGGREEYLSAEIYINIFICINVTIYFYSYTVVSILFSHSQ